MPGIRRKSPSIRNSDPDPNSDLKSILDTEYQSLTRTVVTIESEEDEDEESSYCPSCYERLRHIQYLGPVILRKDEEVPHDYDNWKQCYKCGRKYANSEVKRESKIDDIVDVEEVEPDSSSSSEVQPIAALRYDSRRKGKGKGRLQRFRDIQNMSRRRIKDPEAIAAIKRGLKVTNYEEHQSQD